MTIEATLERIATALETIAKNTSDKTPTREQIEALVKAKPAKVAEVSAPAKVELKIVEDTPAQGTFGGAVEPTKAEPQKTGAPTNVTRQQFMAKFQELYSDAAPNRGRNACVAILGKIGVGKASEIKDEQLSQAQELVLAALTA